MAKQNKFSLEGYVFNLSLVVALAVMGAYFYLQYDIGRKTSELEDLKIEEQKSKTEDQKKVETRILTVQQRLRDYSTALAAHRMDTKFFGRLETLMHPDAYFTGCNVRNEPSVAELTGLAKNFEALGQQIAMLSADTDAIKEVKVEKIGIDDTGSVEFTLVLDINADAVAFK